MRSQLDSFKCPLQFSGIIKYFYEEFSALLRVCGVTRTESKSHILAGIGSMLGVQCAKYIFSNIENCSISCMSLLTLPGQWKFPCIIIVNRKLYTLPPFPNESLMKSQVRKATQINQQILSRHNQLFIRQSQRAIWSNDKKQETISEEKNDKKLLEEEKSAWQRVMHFFTYTIRYAIVLPYINSVKAFFGMGPSKSSASSSSSWYDSFFSSSKQEQAWYQKYNFLKHAKDKVVNKIMVLFGGLFFIYVLAKAIPRAFRSNNLKQQELEIEKKKLELQQLTLEVEKLRLERQLSDRKIE